MAQPHERSDKGEGEPTIHIIPPKGPASSMDRFKKMAGRLVRVSREELARQEASYGEGREVK